MKIPQELVTCFVKAWNKSDETDDLLQEWQINRGWCYQFALLIKEVYGSKCHLYMDQGHAWVKIGRKYYYDCVHLNGTTDMGDIRSWGGDPSEVSTKDLVTHWEVDGYSGDVQWGVIQEAAKMFLKGRK